MFPAKCLQKGSSNLAVWIRPVEEKVGNPIVYLRKARKSEIAINDQDFEEVECAVGTGGPVRGEDPIVDGLRTSTLRLNPAVVARNVTHLFRS
jgi:hypothetical protein